MAIDAEDMLVCIWRFFRFFINTSYICIQKYPFFSGFVLLFFLVYIFFNLLVYHSPFLIFIAILVRIFWSSERPTKIENVKEEENANQKTTLKHSVKEDYVVVNRDSENFSSVIRQKSRRTIVKERDKVRASNDENDMFSLPIDKIAKLVVKERESFSFQQGESSTSNDNARVGSEVSKPGTPFPTDGPDQKMKKSESYGVVSEAETIEEGDDDDDDEEEEEEEAIESGNNALEWTEDDQKNLMDLGHSEIERNKRLESLIAKRRARNLFKIQVEKGLMDMDSVPPCPIAPVFVSRTNPFEVVPNGPNEIEGLHVPGSAPSVLLPTKNPFDLPYDPLEEKPNLMADSFQQEFTAVNQKEMMFCRHESFTYGPFQLDPDHHQDLRDPKLEGFGYPRFKRQSGDHDKLMEKFLSEVGFSKSHVNGPFESGPQVLNSEASKLDSEPPVTEESNDESTSSSSYEMSNKAENSGNLESTQENSEDNNMFTSSIPTIVEPPLYDSSPTANDKNRVDDNIFFPDHQVPHIHTPTFSIASDMQVEVSETGSPPLTVGNMSPNEGDSMSDDVDVSQSNSTNFDTKSYDDISQVMDEVEKLRDTRSSDTLVSEGTEKSWSPTDESVKEENVVYDVRDSVTEIIEVENQEKEEEEVGDGTQVLTGQAIVIEESLQKLPAENGDLDSKNLDEHQTKDSAQPEGNSDDNVTKDSEKQTEPESITDMSKSVEAEDNLNKTEDKKDGLSSVESEVCYVINSCSSPSSPTSALIEPQEMEEISSSNLNQEIDIDAPRSDLEDLVKTSSLDEQKPDDTSLITPQNGEPLVEEDSSSHLSNTGDFETLEEPSAMFSDEANIIFNTNEAALVDDKAAKELLETPVETGPGLLNIENVTVKPEEESINPPSKTPEEATYIPNDALVSEKELDKENLRSVEEINDETEDSKHLFELVDAAEDNLLVTKSFGTESNNLMEQDPVIDQSLQSRELE